MESTAEERTNQGEKGLGQNGSSSDSKTHTLNETIKKLKRMVTLYKKEVTRLKDLSAAGDKKILELNKAISNKNERINEGFFRREHVGRPLEVLGRVKSRANGPIWCFVRCEAIRNGDGDHGSEFYDYVPADNSVCVWEKEDDVVVRAQREYGMALETPDKIMYISNNKSIDMLEEDDNVENSSAQMKDLERQLDLMHDNMERVQEDFRRYRVRSEIVRRQKEVEINKLMESNAEIGAQQAILDNRLEEQLSDAKDRISSLEETNEKLSSSSKSQKADWDRLKRENQQLKQLLDSGAARGDETLAKKYQKLKQEYQAYRKRAMQLLQSKGTGGNSKGGRGHSETGKGNSRKQMHNKSGNEGGTTGIDAETMLYLRNTVIQYMATDRPEVKEQMEGALATVLRFDKQDLAYVKAKRDASRSWSSYFV